MQVVKITPNMTFGQVAVMPEFAGFGEYLMICRPTTWERMWNLPLVSGPNAAPDSYASQRIVRGVQRIVDLADSGKRIAYDIWDEKSCCRDPTRRTTKLFFFPGEPRKPFVLVIAGGGYQSVCNAMEGFPSAVELNEAGYNAFVLSYRVRIKPLMPRPIEDVARALRFIKEHAAEFCVGEAYAVMGFSAGAHLAAEWGTDNKGYISYKTEAPKALVLSYPPIDLSGESAPLSRFADSVCDGDASRLSDYSINKHVWEGYPPTYLWQCADDDIVLPENQAKMVSALKSVNVPCEAVMYERGGHALMKPHDASTEHWIGPAIRFLDQYLGKCE